MTKTVQERAKEIFGEPAYPNFDSTIGGQPYQLIAIGMTKGELFAKDAMAAFISGHQCVAEDASWCVKNSIKYAEALCFALAEMEVQNG